MPRLAAGIASGTEYNPSVAFLLGPTIAELLKRWGMDDPFSDPWKSVSVTRNTDKVRAALLLNLTDHELMHNLQPYHSLAAAGRAVDMYVYPGSYHIKHQPAHRLSVYNRNIDWMNFLLRGVEGSGVGEGRAVPALTDHAREAVRAVQGR